MSEPVDFLAYSVGVVYASACTSLDDATATTRMNAAVATGTDTPWRIADEPFRTGEPNPCPCNDKPATHRHILFVCPSTDALLRQAEERLAPAAATP